jgi:hypothetical protein
VILLARSKAPGFASATINRRLAVISGLFAFQSMRDPDVVNQVPEGLAPAKRRTPRTTDTIRAVVREEQA